MESGQTLIEQVEARHGWSHYRLAKELGVDKSFIGKVAAGQRRLPPTMAAELARLVGQEPRDAALAALVDQEPDQSKRAHLAELFKLAPAAVVFAVALLIGAAPQNAEAATTGALTRADAGPSVYYVNYLLSIGNLARRTSRRCKGRAF